MNKKSWNIALVGPATLIGAQIVECLEERDFPISSLRYLDSGESAGEVLEFRDAPVVVEDLSSATFAGTDIVFFTGNAESARTFCPVAAAAGAICIDTSRAWRLSEGVPLVVPEVNASDIQHFRRTGIIACPDAATVQLVVALKPLVDVSPVRRIVLSTYESVSGEGNRGLDELRLQSGELLNGRPAESSVFPKQMAFNCLPQVGEMLDNGSSSSESDVVLETRKIFGDPKLRMTATMVRVPIFYGLCEAVNITTKEKITVLKAQELLSAAPGVELFLPDSLYPDPTDIVGQDKVCVGRIREDDSEENALNLWVVADNIRKGAASNVVQIAELLVDRYL